jgi:hypothetical protein
MAKTKTTSPNVSKKTVKTWIGFIVIIVILGIAYWTMQSYAPQASSLSSSIDSLPDSGAGELSVSANSADFSKSAVSSKVVSLPEDAKTMAAVSPTTNVTYGRVYITAGKMIYFTTKEAGRSTPLHGEEGTIDAISVATDGSNLLNAMVQRGEISQYPLQSSPVGTTLQVKTAGAMTMLSPTILLATVEGGYLQRFDTTTGKTVGSPVAQITGNVDSMVLSTSGKLLAVGTGGVVRIYRTTTWELYRQWTIQPGEEKLAMAFMNDKRLLIGTSGGRLYQMSAADNRKVAKTLKLSSPIRSVAVTGANEAAVGSENGTVQVLNLTNGAQVEWFSVGKPVNLLAYEPKDGILTAAGYENRFHVWVRK